MADTESTSDLLEKAQLLHQASAIHQAKTPGMNGNGFPGAQAAGAPDGETEQSLLDKGLHVGGGAVQAAVKGMDVGRGLTGGPAVALALKGLTGKTVANLSDVGNAINPTNLKTFPGTGEMMDRAGIPEGAKLSDYMGGYGEKNETPWYLPEKGGMLDPSVRGVGGLIGDVLSDPLTYVSGGASAAAKEALSKGAAKTALESGAKQGILSKLGALAARPAEKLAPMAEKLRELSVQVPGTTKTIYPGRALETVATAPSRAVKDVGERMYNTALLPVEHEGAQYGKEAVGQTLYDAGVKSPINLRKKAQEAADRLMGARNKIFNDAGNAGAQLDMKAAMKEATDTVAAIRAEGRPAMQGIADSIEKQIQEHMDMVKGTPARPASSAMVDSGLKDDYFQPIMKKVETPAVEAVPGRTISPEVGSALKTDLYNMGTDAQWNELRKTPAGAAVLAPLSGGLKKETEAAVERGLGDGAGQSVADINKALGGLLSTARSQKKVGQAAERMSHGARTLTGTDTVLGAASLLEDNPVLGLKAILAKKAMDAARLGTMPAGYALRKLAEHPASATMIDAVTRQKLKELAGAGAEKGDFRGKEN